MRHLLYKRNIFNKIITKNTKKADSDVNEDRSKELLNEIEKATTKKYFDVFKIKLRHEVGDIEYSFSAKWSQIEKAFFSALGKCQVILRLTTFYEQGPSSYGSKPMEQIISDVDNNVDRCFGRGSSN